jgi:hypothetical protein
MIDSLAAPHRHAGEAGIRDFCWRTKPVVDAGLHRHDVVGIAGANRFGVWYYTIPYRKR